MSSPLTDPIGWAKGLISDATMAPINALASGIADAVGEMLGTLGTLWIKLDVPNVWTEGGGTGATVAFLHSEVAPLVGLLAVLGIIVGATRIAWEQRAEPGRDLVRGLFTLVLVTGCGVPFIGLLVSGADAWAQSILDDASGGDFGRNLTGLLALSGGAAAPMLVVFLGIIALLVSLAQIALLVLRGSMLILLAGLLPVAASMTTTATGREHFRRYCAWVVALVAWKPCAALIYAAAFRLVGTRELDASGIGQVLIGLSLMAMAVLAMPALLRFLVPAVGALHVGGGSGAAMSAAAFALPTGAKMIAAHAMRGGGGGGEGSRGPGGASMTAGAQGASAGAQGASAAAQGASAAAGAAGAPGVGAAAAGGSAGAAGGSGAATAGAAGAAGPAGAAVGAVAQAAGAVKQHTAAATDHATRPPGATNTNQTNGGPDGN